MSRADAARRRAARRVLHDGPDVEDGEPRLQLIASYGFGGRKSLANTYRMKESLVGQCAFEKKRILLADVPEDFIYIATGLGEAPPRNVVVLPVLFEGETKAVIELASFQPFSSEPPHLPRSADGLASASSST